MAAVPGARSAVVSVDVGRAVSGVACVFCVFCVVSARAGARGSAGLEDARPGEDGSGSSMVLCHGGQGPVVCLRAMPPVHLHARAPPLPLAPLVSASVPSQHTGPRHRLPDPFQVLPRSHCRLRPRGVPSVTRATWGRFGLPSQPANRKRASDNVNSRPHTACHAESDRECLPIDSKRHDIEPLAIPMLGTRHGPGVALLTFRISRGCSLTYPFIASSLMDVVVQSVHLRCHLCFRLDESEMRRIATYPESMYVVAPTLPSSLVSDKSVRHILPTPMSAGGWPSPR